MGSLNSSFYINKLSYAAPSENHSSYLLYNIKLLK